MATGSHGSTLYLPRDLWPLIITFLPVAALGRIARVCKFIRDAVADENHWRQRLINSGLLSLFLMHPARKHFIIDQSTSHLDLRAYFRDFHVAESKPFFDPPSFHPEEDCTLESLAFASVSDKQALLRQFPAEYCASQIIRAYADDTSYPNYAARTAYDGEEWGLFLLPDGKFAYYYGWRYEIRSAENNDCKYVQFNAATLREFKSQFFLHELRCPLPCSRLDWAWHLLHALDEALLNGAEQRLPRVVEHYAALLALRKARCITVKYGAPQIDPCVRAEDLSALFKIDVITTNALLVKINAHFKSLLARGCDSIYSLVAESGKAWPSSTRLLVDREVWVVKPR